MATRRRLGRRDGADAPQAAAQHRAAGGRARLAGAWPRCRRDRRHLSAARHLRPRPQRPRSGQGRPRAPHRQARPMLLAHPCRRHRGHRAGGDHAPIAGAIYNVADDLPAPTKDIVAYACELLGMPVPPAIPWEQAAPTMGDMARSFYAESRRVKNDRIKHELGVMLRYPTYREGLRAIAAAAVRPPARRQLLDGRDQARDVGRRAEAMIAALHEGGDHLGRLEMPGDLQGIFPRHVGIALAVQQPHRTRQRELLVEHEMIAAFLDQLPGEDRRLGRILRRPFEPAVTLAASRDPRATGPSATCVR